MFQRAETDDFSFTININLNSNSKEKLEYFNFIGKLIAKALIDNLTINLCFNKLIYMLLLNEPITKKDLVFIDKPVYIYTLK